MTREYTDAGTFIGKTVRVSIDRPLGSRHPDAGFIYPVNYGFLPGVPAPDGENLDAYILGVAKPITTFTGTCIAVIRRTDDDDDKLVVASSDKDFSDEQILEMTGFQERFFRSSVIREPVHIR
ncbi:MAG: inorganic pyrophosphatase [Gemmatimonadota bacterium]|nr:inorganic pyrophosphatase [Gemmatimonadota bacterium]